MIHAERDGWYVRYEGVIAICFRVLNEENDRALPLFYRSVLAR
jgi:vancomycin permeability regulator SanA